MLFTRTCDGTRKIALSLRNLGLDAIPIHGQMSQPKRLGALNKFKAGQRSILVATGGYGCFAALSNESEAMRWSVPTVQRGLGRGCATFGEEEMLSHTKIHYVLLGGAACVSCN